MATDSAVYAPQSASMRDVERTSTLSGSQKKTSRYYRPELDMLRLFAFLFVFFGHAIDVNFNAGLFHRHPAIADAFVFLKFMGGYGLSLFFFLSAFLITTLLMVEQDRTGTVKIRSFYIRRMLRIWPLYFAYMGAAFVIGQYWEPAHISLNALISYLTLSANWYVTAAGPVTFAAQFLWSISVEEQFYLLWPTAVRSLTRNGIRNFCFSLALVSLAGIGLLAATGSTILHIWFNSIAEALFFVTGGLLALRLGLRQQSPSWLKFIGGAALCAGCWFSASSTASLGRLNDLVSPAHAILSYVLIAIGSASLLWSFLHMPRRLMLPQLVYLGRISYGLYVFHGMALLIGRNFIGSHLRGGAWMLPTLLLTVLMAIASYEGFEKPFLKLKHRFEVVHSRAA